MGSSRVGLLKGINTIINSDCSSSCIIKRFSVRSISHGRLATTECEGLVQDLELQQ